MCFFSILCAHCSRISISFSRLEMFSVIFYCFLFPSSLIHFWVQQKCEYLFSSILKCFRISNHFSLLAFFFFNFFFYLTGIAQKTCLQSQIIFALLFLVCCIFFQLNILFFPKSSNWFIFEIPIFFVECLIPKTNYFPNFVQLSVFF